MPPEHRSGALGRPASQPPVVCKNLAEAEKALETLKGLGFKPGSVASKAG